MSATAPPYPPVEHMSYQTATPNDMPPPYESAGDPTGIPPTYESLFGEFRQVESPKGLAQFLHKAIAIVVGTVTAAVIIAILNVIPLGMIVIGALNLQNCPAEPYIPIWLVVTGVFALLKSAANFYYRARRPPGQLAQPSDINPNPFDGLLSCFLIVWFIIGSVWVYTTSWSVQYGKPGTHYYCDQFTYTFAFIFITVGYCLFFIACMSFCCCCCCICCRPQRDRGGVIMHPGRNV